MQADSRQFLAQRRADRGFRGGLLRRWGAPLCLVSWQDKLIPRA